MKADDQAVDEAVEVGPGLIGHEASKHVHPHNGEHQPEQHQENYNGCERGHAGDQHLQVQANRQV
jgi:hypothetical protein